MKKSTNIQLKAFFLLIIFFSSIVIGLACTVGVRLHDHHKAVDHQSDKNNCCKDELAKLEKTNKTTLSPVNDYSHPKVCLIATPLFYDFNILALSTHHYNYSYFAQSYHPPIPDIRIAVQSFQI